MEYVSAPVEQTFFVPQRHTAKVKAVRSGVLLQFPIKDASAAGAAREGEATTYDVIKRVVDISGSFVLLVLTAPLCLIAALAVKLTSKGPVIYSQERLTRGGAPFTIYKFRTMTQDAEAATGAVWAAHNDPRTTPVGRILRKTRVDELPQLINVLKGEMSLIGPRPERPEFVETLSESMPSFNKRFRVKAGLTGLAQVCNGYASCEWSYRKKLACDLVYVRKRSIALDAAIAARTVWVMMTGFGSR